MKRFLLVLVFNIILSHNLAFSKPFYARVIAIKGKVSKLSPGQIHPVWMKKGDSVREDTSILTRKKSYVRLKILEDNSSVVIGPESKMVLNKVKRKKGSIVTLLTGTLRGSIQKRKNSSKKIETKFIVKTHTAALGIRGTEFVTVVNNENKVTSLVTLEGEVAMAKTEDVSLDKQNTEELTKKFDAPEAVVVKKGRASTSYLHREDLTAPQKLNPVQLIALKDNKNLEIDKKGKAVKTIKLTEEKKEELYGKNLDNSEEELKDAPKNGAFVDLKSGIFIPPSSNTKAALGRIDSQTGAYIPTKGVKLDPVKGFVAISEKKSDKIKALKLNKIVKYKELPKNYAPGHSVHNNYSITPYLKKPLYGLELGLQAGEANIINPETDKESSFKMKGGLVLNLFHKRPINHSAAWSIAFMAASYDHDTKQTGISTAPDDIDENNITAGGKLGLEYRPSKNIIFSSHFIFEDELFLLALTRSSSEGLIFKQKTIGIKKFEIKGQVPLLFTTLGEAFFQNVFSAGNKSLYIESGKVLGLGIKKTFGPLKKHYFKSSFKHSEFILDQFIFKANNLKILYGYHF